MSRPGSNCVSWSGGTLDVKSSSSSWIWAMKQGSPLDSNDPAANIQQHDNNGQFTFDLTKAAGGNSVNPFVGATTSAPGSTATGSGGALNGAAGQVKVSKTTTTNSIIAHGTLMGLAVVVILPLGALMMRLFSFPSLVRVHVFAQVLGFTVLLAGFGVGVWVGVITNNVGARFACLLLCSVG